MHMHKAKRILVLLLVLALTVTQLPVAVLAYSGDEDGEIIAFETLSEETVNQTVALGTPLEDLNLPNTLNATVRIAASAYMEVVNEPAQDSGETQKEEVSGTVPDADNESKDELQAENGQPGMEAGGEQQESETDKPEQVLNIPIHVKWVSAPDYDGGKIGTYTFTALIEGFKVSAVLPSISVTVNEITGIVTAFAEQEEIRWQNTGTPVFPERLEGTVAGKTIQIPVTWQSRENYDKNAPKRGLYVFDAVLGEGYTLADGVEAPRITVYIPQSASSFTFFRMVGSGTDTSPLEITTAAQLAEIAELVNAGRLETFLFNNSAATVYLELKSNLDLSGYGASYNDGKGWKPIGTEVNPFKGHFDGGYYTISGLYIRDTSLNNAGLFGSIENGSVQRLILSDVNVHGLTAGGIAGQIKNTTIEKCGVNGSVIGNSKVGGVVGVLLENSSIKNSYSIGNVNATGNQVGGIAGQLFYSTATVQNCYSTASVNGNWYVGGIAGDIASGTDMVKDCAALNPSISAAAYKGRVAGQNHPNALSGNIAFSGMTGGTFSDSSSGLDGESRTAAAIKADGTIGGRFTTANGWTVENGKLPGFGAAIDIQEYIVDSGGADPNFSGEGTYASPFCIATAEQLVTLANLVNGGTGDYNKKYYKLINDIDLSAYGTSNAGFNYGKGWVPIGSYDRNFRGHFDGGGHTITGLTINNSNMEYAGLFGYILPISSGSGSVRNLGLKDVNIRAKGYVGGVVGFPKDIIVENCFVTGSISGTGNYVGGVAGWANCPIKNCYMIGDVSSSGDSVGGVVGRSYFLVENCYMVGTVRTTYSFGTVGGVAGMVAEMKDCMALNSSVSGTNVGRVAGELLGGTLSGNKAFTDMTVSRKNGSYDGEDVSAGQLQAIANWPAGFDASPWTSVDGFLPGLFGETVDMPEYITDKLTGYFAGGDGSESNPYQITTAAQLAKLAELVKSNDETVRNEYNSKYYKLMNNLDLTDYGISNTDFNGGRGWIPIGSKNRQFKGVFDGNYKTITGLSIKDSSLEAASLFGYILNGRVKNLGIADMNITGYDYVGGLSGFASGSSEMIQNCYATGTITGKSDVGGLVGYATGTVKNCYTTGSVTGSDKVGGIIGSLSGTLRNSYTTASVSGFSNVGGLAGYAVTTATTLQSCVALNPFVNGNKDNTRRLIGSDMSTNTYANNYAFSGMKINGTAIRGGAINNKDGADLIADQIYDISFWTTAGNWKTAWDSNIWTMEKDKLPILTGFSGQSGDGGVYLIKRDIANATVEITGGPFTYTGSVITPDLNVTYDGQSLIKDVDYTVTVTSTDDTVSGTSAGTNAGTVTLMITGKGNFTGTKTGVTFTIDKKVPTEADLTYDLTAKTYNGLAQPLSVTAKTTGIGAATVKYDGSTAEPKDADSYAVTVSIAEGTNYAAADISLGDYVINRAVLTVTGIAAKTYDGTTDASGLALTFGGLQNGESLTPVTDYTVTNAQFDSADAGGDKTVSGTVVLASNGPIAKNYSLASTTLSLTKQSIHKAITVGVPQTLEVVKNYQKSYEFHLPALLPVINSPKSLGTVTYAPVIDTNNDGVLKQIIYTPGELPNTLVIDVNSVADAGKTATVKVKVQSTNYEDFDVIITIRTVDPTPLTITGLTVRNKTYDGTNTAFLDGTATLVGVQSGDDVTLTGAPSAVFSDANVGTGKTVTITGLYLVGEDAAKYSLDLSGFTGTITAKALTDDMFTLYSGIITYTGTAQTPVVTAVDGGRPLIADTDYTVAYTNNINVGTANVSITGKGNYTGTVSMNFTIEKATPAALIWPNASSITYGETLSASSLTGGSTTGTWAWTDETISPPTGTAGYEVTFTPADTANYDWSGVTLRQNVSVTVNKAIGLTASTQPSMNVKEGVTRRYEYNMDDIALSKSDTGAKTYNAAEGIDISNILSNVQVNGSKLTYSIAGKAAVGNTATVNITISTANYEDVTATLTITVIPKDTQTIGFEHLTITKTYGDAKFTQTAILQGPGGTGPITYSSDNTAVATVNAATGEVTIVGAGSANITATKEADDEWYAATAVYGLVVSPKTVTITAHDKTAKVGLNQPAYTYTVTGLITDDNLTREPTVTCPTADMSTVGTYPIVPGGAIASANYVLQYQNGTLTVVPLSTACELVSVSSPADSSIEDTSITATVANNVSSQIIDVTVSADATWALYSDMACTSEITGKTMSLSVGTNTAYIKILAEDGITTQTYTVTITRSAPAGGGGFGGGSNGGPIEGGDSGDSSSRGNTTTTTLDNIPGQPIIAAVPVTATLGADNSANATISDKAVSDAIAKAQEEVNKNGKSDDDIAVVLNVTMPEDANSLTTTLTSNSLNSLVSAGVSRFELNGAPVSLNLDLRTLQTIQNQSEGDVSITIAPATGVSEEAEALIGNRPVYSITISYVKDGKTVNISSFGSGTATISIPYTPGRNEAVGYLFGVYVDKKGTAKRIPGSAYDTGRRSLVIPTSHFSVYGVGYTSPSAMFTDIGNHKEKEAIDYVVGKGLLSGTTETTFAPNKAMTRGMLATALGRLAGVDVKAYATNSFTDVKANSPFRPYIEWAYKKGVVQSIGNKKFAPNRAITREEIAAIFVNYAKATGYKLPVSRKATAYSDASSIGSAYKKAIKAMQQAGIMSGGSGNKFNPKAVVTRAEVATMLYRYIKLSIDPTTAQGWAKNDDGRYMYYKDGNPVTDWQTIDGARYYFSSTGILQTGWVKDGNNWRYYADNKAVTGWRDIDSGTGKKRFYFDENAIMVSDKWIKIDGKWYYFYADGSLAMNTRIDDYEIDKNGVRKTK